MIAVEKKSIRSKIAFASKSAEKVFDQMCTEMDRAAEDVLLKALYQYGHRVIKSRVGETKVGGRKKVIYVETENLNGKSVIYRVDFFGSGQRCDSMGSEIRKGWKAVSVW